MPASVAAANPTTVMPYSLAVAFQTSLQATFEMNIYRDSTVQRMSWMTTARRTWTIEKALSSAEIQALFSFYGARRGPLREFWFYDMYETNPPQDATGYDPTGVKTEGRYAVRFEGNWDDQFILTRNRIGIALVQVS